MDMYRTDSSGITFKKHMLKTYTWMFLGVVITFVSAFVIANVPAIMLFAYSGIMPLLFIVAQFGVVIALSARIMKMKETTAKILFIAYSVLTGITFSILGYAYAAVDIAAAFIAAVAFYGCLVVIGATTKADLSKIGTIAFAGLFGLILYQIFAMIFHFDANVTLISIIGLIIFCGITTWDVQKAKELYFRNEGNDALLANLSIYSAFELYLDFINIFLYILRILGNAKD